MLAVHWSPVKNTKNILRNGIRPSKDGVFCFPLTGHPHVDKWWVNAFRRWGWRHRTAYNGFVFRIVEGDLPAAFSDWRHGPEDKPLNSIAQVKAEFESAIMFRFGAWYFDHSRLEASLKPHDLDLPDHEARGREIAAQNPERYLEALNGNPKFMENVFANYQIVLSRAISPDRILRVIPGGNDYGRNIARKKKRNALISLSNNDDPRGSGKGPNPRDDQETP
jgi:hypothetical protein